jgi:hypothetical protein
MKSSRQSSRKLLAARGESVQTVQPLDDSLRSTGADASVQAVFGGSDGRYDELRALRGEIESVI